MAEVTSGNVTVMVLHHAEADALRAVLAEVGYEVAGDMPKFVGELHEVYEALGVPSFTSKGGE